MVDILHIAFGGLGGHAGVIVPLSSELGRAGIRSGVVAYAPEPALRENAAAWELLDLAIPVARRSRLDLWAMVSVSIAVIRSRPRVVVCHTLKPTLAAFIGMLLSGHAPRLVLVEHQQVDLRGRGDELRTAATLPCIRVVVFLSHDARSRYRLRRLRIRAVRRAVVVPTGVDTQLFSPVPPRPRADALVVGMASRLTPTKDVATLIRAVGLLRAEGRELRLLIAGEGPDRTKLEALVDELALGASVDFVGHLTEGELVAFLRSLDVYVQSTQGETLSTALLQAYAVGLASVASAVSGITDLVRDGVDGLLVAEGSPSALARALARLGDDDALRARIGAAARSRAVDEFDVTAMAASYRVLMADLDPGGPW